MDKSEGFKKFLKQLSCEYSEEIIKKLFCEQATNITDDNEFYEFFKYLKDSISDLNRRKELLSSLIVDKVPSHKWMYRLNFLISEDMILYKYPKYVSSLEIGFNRNAYNCRNVKNYEYTSNDVKILSESISLNLFNDEFPVHVIKLGSCEEQLSKGISDFINEKRTVFYICNIYDNHWAVICLFYCEYRFNVFYKDSLEIFSKNLPSNLSKIIKNRFTIECCNVNFIVNQLIEQEQSYDSALFALSNYMKIVHLIRIKYERFASSKFLEGHKFTKQSEISGFRKLKFPQLYVRYYVRANDKGNIIDLLDSLGVIPTGKNLNEFVELMHSSKMSAQRTIFSNHFWKIMHLKLIRLLINGWDKAYLESIIDKITSLDKLEISLNILDLVYNFERRRHVIVDLTTQTERHLRRELFENNFRGTEVKQLSKLREEFLSLNENKSVSIGSDKISDSEQMVIKIFKLFKNMEDVYGEEKISEKIITIWKSCCDKCISKHKVSFTRIDWNAIQSDLKKIGNELSELYSADRFVLDSVNVGSVVGIVDKMNLRGIKEKEGFLKDIVEDFNEEISQVERISEWNQDKIKSKVALWKCDPNKVDISVKIAIIKRAIKLTMGMDVRPVQILTLISMLNPLEGLKGRLAQVNTGEGKSLIIAMLAAFYALEGRTVDIITSSSELAKPQSEEFKVFFCLMGLSASNNCHGPDIGKRYKCDIVYGAASDYQGDYLRDDFLGLGTRNGRIYDLVIIDEVDNLLIDCKDSVVKLVSKIPAMDHLLPVMVNIWKVVTVADSLVIEKDDKLFKKDEMDGELKPLDGEKKEFIRTKTSEAMKNKLEKIHGNAIQVPKHLKQYVKAQLSKWIDNAIFAKFDCELEKHYFFMDQKIVPVDFGNTGSILKDTRWGNGLHIFLEMKHGLKPNPETLCTNYISTSGYFEMYKLLFGFTGTIGEKSVQSLLEEVYRVDNIIVPEHKTKQHITLKPIIVEDKSEWFFTIVQTSFKELTSGRAVLIIVPYIKYVNEIKILFMSMFNYPVDKIYLYSTGDNKKIMSRTFESGDLIVATNLAGRGTDIKLSEDVERNGGLHVLVTSLPLTRRVEFQNIGRTSRSGFKGTSQIIIISPIKNIYKVQYEQDKQEEKALESTKEIITGMLIKDFMFKKFCEILKDLSEEKHRYAVEERFGLMLKMEEDAINSAGSSSDEIKSIIERFKEEIDRDKVNERLVKNPYYLVQNGKALIDKGEYQSAIDEFTKAIEIDENYAAVAYYNRAVGRLFMCVNDRKKNENLPSTRQHFNDIRKDFEEAQNHYRNLSSSLQRLPKVSVPNKSEYNEFIQGLWELYESEADCIEKITRDNNVHIVKGIEKGYNYRVRVIQRESTEKQLANDTSDLCNKINAGKIVVERDNSSRDMKILWGLGVLKIVIGCCFLIFGGPAIWYWGTSLIINGIFDYFQSIIVYFTGYMNWTIYSIMQFFTFSIEGFVSLSTFNELFSFISGFFSNKVWLSLFSVCSNALSRLMSWFRSESTVVERQYGDAPPCETIQTIRDPHSFNDPNEIASKSNCIQLFARDSNLAKPRKLLSNRLLSTTCIIMLIGFTFVFLLHYSSKTDCFFVFILFLLVLTKLLWKVQRSY